MLKIETKKYLIIIAVIGLLIFLHFTKILQPAESIINITFRPILVSFYQFGSWWQVAFQTKPDENQLLAKLKQMENQLNQLITENARLKVLEEENQSLRQHLRFFSKNPVKFILANIIAKGELANPSEENQKIIIDKGGNDGLLPGLAVVSPTIYQSSNQGIIIGKITAVKENLAEVNLIINQNCKLAVSLQNQNKTSGISHGELGLTIKMEFIPQTEEIKTGEIVITSGLEQKISRGLVVGKISQVIKESNELWQSAVIEPIIDVNQLTIVAILLP